MNWNLTSQRIAMIFGSLMMLMTAPKSQTRGQSMEYLHLTVKIHCGWDVNYQIFKSVCQRTLHIYNSADQRMTMCVFICLLNQAYSSILYLKPRMQIIIRGQKVKTQLVSKSLAHIIKDTYKPTFLVSFCQTLNTVYTVFKKFLLNE